MPADHLWGTEGVPEGVPPKHDCRVFYDEADAEQWLLEQQERPLGMYSNLVLFEAKTGAEAMDYPGAYKVVALPA